MVIPMSDRPTTNALPKPRPLGRLRLLLATAILLICLTLIVVMFAVTGGYFLAAHWTAFYVGVALLTGLAFWLFTDTRGEFTNKRLGILLVGGGGIGACFMILAHFLTPVDVAQNVQIVKTDLAGPVFVTHLSASVEKPVQLPGNPARFVIEFAEGEALGTFDVTYYQEQVKHVRTYSVGRGRKPEYDDRVETEGG